MAVDLLQAGNLAASSSAAWNAARNALAKYDLRLDSPRNVYEAQQTKRAVLN